MSIKLNRQYTKRELLSIGLGNERIRKIEIELGSGPTYSGVNIVSHLIRKGTIGEIETIGYGSKIVANSYVEDYLRQKDRNSGSDIQEIA